MFGMDEAKQFEKFLCKKYNFNLKRTGEIYSHIGMDFFCDKNGKLYIKLAKYIAKMMDTYTGLFGTLPNTG